MNKQEYHRKYREKNKEMIREKYLARYVRKEKPITNIFTTQGDICTLTIISRDQTRWHCIFDQEEREEVEKHLWHINRGRGTVYVTTGINKEFLSRFIMNTPDNKTCDIINGNTLDLRKSNLRNCEFWEAHKNMKNTTVVVPYKHIYNNAVSKIRIYRVEINKTRVGTFCTIKEAIKARNKFLKDAIKPVKLEKK